MVIALGQKFLEEEKSRSEECCLREEKTLDCGKGDDAEEERDQGLNFQLEEGEDGEELLQLLLFGTACEIKIILSYDNPKIKIKSFK